MTSIRMTHTTAVVLQALAAGHRYGFEIMEVTGLPGGTVYPILRRLEAAGLIAGGWEAAAEAHEDGRPPRRYYEIGDDGATALREAAQRYRMIGDTAAVASQS